MLLFVAMSILLLPFTSAFDPDSVQAMKSTPGDLRTLRDTLGKKIMEQAQEALDKIVVENVPRDVDESTFGRLHAPVEYCQEIPMTLIVQLAKGLLEAPRHRIPAILKSVSRTVSRFIGYKHWRLFEMSIPKFQEAVDLYFDYPLSPLAFNRMREALVQMQGYFYLSLVIEIEYYGGNVR